MRNASPLFRLGQIVATPGALAAFERAEDEPRIYLHRHQIGDWGDLDVEDRRANDSAVRYEGDRDRQGRVLSAYRLTDHTAVWVVTEHDRSVTTILLPSEY